MEKKYFDAEYPYNLIIAAKGNSSVGFPVTSREDVILGLEYVLAKLDKQEALFLRQRFEEGKLLEEIGLDLIPIKEDAKEWEQRILKKLRVPTRWGFIQFGIDGYLRNRIQEVKQEAYHKGYADGYQKGIGDSSFEDFRKNLPEHLLNMPIETMGLPTHAYNCLFRAKCERIQDVVSLDEDGIYRIRNMGKVTAGVIGEKLQELGINNTAWDKYIIYKKNR